MRTIIFRGKQLDGKWVFGGIEILGDMAFILPTDMSHVLCVDPDTVGQFTDLVDKNGAMIFEGDILSAHFDNLFPENETRETVVWHDFGFSRCFKGNIFDPLEDVDGQDFEVIGNIHDNPELLEVLE